LAGGFLASLSQLVVDPSSTIPTIGASGAIAAVMGAYVMLYPSAVVETLIPLPILFTTFPVPAPVFLGVWFILQVYNGVQIAGSEGVAWWAHIGGFAFGFLVAAAMVAAHWASPPVPEEQRHREGVMGL
jgi:membrane associated rhomboid family serine protease